MRALRKLRPGFRIVADLFPFTLLGQVLLAGSIVAFWRYAYQRADLVVLALTAAVMVTCAVGLVLVVATALLLWRALRGRPSAEAIRLECGFPTRTGFSMSSLWFVPLVHVRWSWVQPEAHLDLALTLGRLHETVTAHRRGIYDGVVRRIEVSDAFHLVRVAFELRDVCSVRALPSAGLLRHINALRSLASGDDQPDPGGRNDGDRSELRHYAPGDPVKFILWRVFAKNRQVVVRTPERAVSAARKTYAYLVAGDADEPAAGAARVALDSGALGSAWVFGADACEESAESKGKALELIARSARATEAQHGAGLSRFLERHGGSGRVIVFVPARPGPWLGRALAALGRRGGAPADRLEFAVCSDGMTRAAERGALGRLFFSDRPSYAPGVAGELTTDAKDLDAVIRALAATRARVSFVDRRAGRVHDAATLRANAAQPAPGAAT